MSDELDELLPPTEEPKPEKKPKKKRYCFWVSEEVFQAVAKRARPLEDSADDVLRRILDLPSKKKDASEDAEP